MVRRVCAVILTLTAYSGTLSTVSATAPPVPETSGGSHPETPGGAHTVTGSPAVVHIPARRETTTAGQVVPKTHKITLVAQRAPDGSLTYNGTVPGPTIEIYEGDEVELTLINQLDVDVSVHVHGVHYKIDSDGTRHTHSFAPPGGRYVYRWIAAVGTAGYWHYHDHVIGPGIDGVRGIEQGLYGALIVRKAGDPLPDKTFVLVMQHVWFNNQRYPHTPLLEAKLGERVEFVVITHGSRFHTFHIHGHRWLERGTNRIIDTFTQDPGESTGFQVIAGEGVGPGQWMYHCHVHDHLEDGMFGFFMVRP
jgi:FtsP/CotA-like multicopper oxidase with cupredoxin domain